jgi:hypothetical protein
VDNDKNLDLVRALRLAADVQPIKADVSMINDVRTSSEILARMPPLLVHLTENVIYSKGHGFFKRKKLKCIIELLQ